MPRLKCAPPDFGSGRPTRLPYARQAIDEEDIAAVVEVLRSPFLTTGPTIRAFEDALAAAVGAEHAVAVSNGTAALHAAMYVAGIGPGDEVIVPAMTFAATASAVVFQGGKPVFADVDAETLLLDPDRAAAKITPRTRAIVAVDYAGQPCDYDPLRAIAEQHGLNSMLFSLPVNFSTSRASSRTVRSWGFPMFVGSWTDRAPPSGAEEYKKLCLSVLSVTDLSESLNRTLSTPSVVSST